MAISPLTSLYPFDLFIFPFAEPRLQIYTPYKLEGINECVAINILIRRERRICLISRLFNFKVLSNVSPPCRNWYWVSFN